jgi:hypothetical protein
VKIQTLMVLTAALAVLAAVLAGDWSAGRAQPVASIALPPPGATKQLYPGCNNITLTFADGTSSDGLIEATNPPRVADAIWRHDAAGQRWEAFSPATSQVSDLTTVDFLDAVWLCLPAPAPAAVAPPATDGGAAPAADSSTPGASGEQTPTSGSNGTLPADSTGPLPTPIPGSSGGGGGGSPAAGTVSTVLAPTSALTGFRYSMQTSLEIDGEAFNIRSTGAFQAPDRMSCAMTGSALGFTFDMDKLVVIGNDAWLDAGLGWASTTAGDPGVVADLESCPGSNVFWQSLGLPGDLGGLQGPVTTVNGVAAVRVSLLGLGLVPPDSQGATVRTFDLWVAQDGGWVVALASDVSVSDVTSPNNPSISVVPPV